MCAFGNGSGHGNLDLLYVRGQQGQRREGCRTDGKALTGSSSGVAEGIEGIGTVAHLLAELAHLCISSRIVGDRTVGIGSQRDTQGGEHTDSSDTDTIEALTDGSGTHGEVEAIGKQVTQHDGYSDGHHWHTGADHARANTLDDDCCRTRLAGFGNTLGGLVAMRGVILGGLAYHNACRQTADNREAHANPVFYTQQVKDDERGDGYEHSAHIGADTQRM